MTIKPTTKEEYTGSSPGPTTRATIGGGRDEAPINPPLDRLDQAERAAPPHAERALAAAPHLMTLSQAMELVGAPVAIRVRERGRHPLCFANRAFLRLTGQRIADCDHQPVGFLAGADTDRAALARLERALDDGRPFAGELLLYRKNGEPFRDRLGVEPVSDAEGRVVAFVETHQAVGMVKQRSAQSKSQAEQGRATDRGQINFLANITHELRTPLNAIIGFSEIMETEFFGPMNERYRDYAHDIHGSGLHLLGLVDDILDFSKAEARKLELHEETLDVGPIITESVRLATRSAEQSGIKLSVSLARDLPHLRGDAKRMRQILLNLISNGVKFTPAGGEVLVAADVEPAGDLLVSVIDTGVGLKPADVRLAMEPFGQIDNELIRDRNQSGTGLGLPLTKRLVELHGGSLELLSRPDAGTIMTVRFPPDRVVH